MAIGDKILALRKKHGWSQQNLVKKFGTSGPNVGRYEHGDMIPWNKKTKKPLCMCSTAC